MNQGPLTPLSIAILLALVDEERHGYGIIKDVERQTDGHLTIGTGTLYAALQRMQDEELIQASSRALPPDEDARRKYYGITERGRAVARSEIARLAKVVDVAHARDLRPDVG